MTDPAADAEKLLDELQMAEAIRVAKCWLADGKHGGVTQILCRAVLQLNTRPQPAPPEGEPDFDVIARRFLEPNYPDVAARSTVALLVRFAYYLKDRLGLAARLKVEDAEKKDGRQSFLARVSLQGKAIAVARLVLEENVTVAANAIVALIDSERADVEAKLAERETELAKAQEWVEESQSCFAELRDVGKSNSRIDWLYEETSKYLNSRHAARQQQKASAEPTAGEGE